MNMSNYPSIILSEDNPEIEDCTLFSAFVGLFADFTMRDGTHFPYADVIAYEDGAFVLAIGGVFTSEDYSYTIIAPVSAIASITYI